MVHLGKSRTDISVDWHSGLDGVSIAWDFTLEVSSFRNATIDAVQSNVVVDPDGNTRVDVTVRNTGNTPDTLP